MPKTLPDFPAFHSYDFIIKQTAFVENIAKYRVQAEQAYYQTIFSPFSSDLQVIFFCLNYIIFHPFFFFLFFWCYLHYFYLTAQRLYVLCYFIEELFENKQKNKSVYETVASHITAGPHFLAAFSLLSVFLHSTMTNRCCIPPGSQAVEERSAIIGISKCQILINTLCHAALDLTQRHT